MKTLLTTIILLITTTLFSQDNYDLFMQGIGVENNAKSFVNDYIDKLSKATTSPTPAEWASVKKDIDYSAYLFAVKTILLDNYTSEEVSSIVAANSSGIFTYPLKPEFGEQLYRVSRAFAKIVNAQMKELIIPEQ